MRQIDKIAYTNKLTQLNLKAKFAISMAMLIVALATENIPVYIGMFLIIIGFILIRFE